MSKISQGLNQRNILLKILDKYRNIDTIENDKLKNDINTISNIDNKELVYKTILNEIYNSQSICRDIFTIILLDAFEDSIFEATSLKLLKDKKIEDDKKLLIISLIKEKGLEFNYKDINLYIENPESIAHEGLKKFLSNIVSSPEIQIDLLDFYTNIPTQERTIFLNNLQEEFQGNELVSAFSILAQLKLEEENLKIILEVLLENISPYAKEGLEYILQNTKIPTKTRTRIKKQIKLINEKYPNFINPLFTSNGLISNCYIGFLDGKSNFSLVFTRKKYNDTLDVLLMTANINMGITSCMGFQSVTMKNFTDIMKRLFNDSPSVKINPIALKSIYQYYFGKSQKNNTEIPYELIVWKNMLNDIRTINYDISEFINSKLDIIKLTKDKVEKFVKSKIIETWFYLPETNEQIENLIKKIEENHIINLDEIDDLTKAMAKEDFITNKKFMSELKSRLLMQSYIAHLAKLKITSACAYSLCFKNPYINLVVESIIDKSLYHYFNAKINELEEKNIFKKTKPTNFTKEELEILLAQLEEKWS